MEPDGFELQDHVSCQCGPCHAEYNALYAAGWEWRIRTPTLESLERRMDSWQGRTRVARPSRQASRATARYRASSVRPIGQLSNSMRLGLGLKPNSPLFLFFELLAPPFPAPLFSFLPFQFLFSLLLSLLSFPLLPVLLFYLVSQLPFSLLPPSLFLLFFLLLAPPFPAPLFSFLPFQLLF